MRSGARNQLVILALAAAIVPFVTFNLTYWIASSLDHVRSCFTYLYGCTSVSSTGRQMPEFWVFKVGVFALAAALALHWRQASQFLFRLGVSTRGVRTLEILAYLSVVALLVYVVTLGLPDEQFGKLRRIGTNGFAFLNWFTQIAFVVLYRPVRIDTTRILFRWLIVATAALLLVGLSSEIAKTMGWPRKETNNVAAWNAFLVLTIYYLILARIWWHHGRSAGRAASPSE
jgi:hypothetical protein